MTPEASPPVRLGRDVVVLPVDDGSARLLDLNGSFHALSRSGFDMLRGVLRDGPDGAVAGIVAAYSVDPAVARADLHDLLETLGSKGLISDRGEQPERRSRLARACIGAFARSPLAGSAGPLMVFARVSFAWFGWSETVAAWAGLLTGVGRRPSPAPPDHRRVDARVRALAARLPGIDCKERALAAWVLLARQGVPASLVVGVHLYPLTGHCWCEANDQVLTDDAAFCRAYTPVVRYEITRDGHRQVRPEAGLPA